MHARTQTFIYVARPRGVDEFFSLSLSLSVTRNTRSKRWERPKKWRDTVALDTDRARLYTYEIRCATYALYMDISPRTRMSSSGRTRSPLTSFALQRSARLATNDRRGDINTWKKGDRENLTRQDLARDPQLSRESDSWQSDSLPDLPAAKLTVRALPALAAHAAAIDAVTVDAGVEIADCFHRRWRGRGGSGVAYAHHPAADEHRPR